MRTGLFEARDQMMALDFLDVHAVRTKQGGKAVYAMFVPGARVLEIADLARFARKADGSVAGFQRPEIRAHVRSIANYLDARDVLFPNAIVLALDSDVRFKAKRGPNNASVQTETSTGVLSIPVRAGRKSAWIVDGQQRALALAQSEADALPVPVIAFSSSDIAVHREQFILVNKARPLDHRLIDELLPSVTTNLPAELARRKVPSALCATLNETPGSPFHGLIKRPSGSAPTAVVTDSSLTTVIHASVNDPRGALAAHATPDGSGDVGAMYGVMHVYWSAVRDVFPEAWGLPPERSRLMHSAGLAAMGVLMDQIMTRPDINRDPRRVRTILSAIAPHCRWTSGRWEALNRDWDELQSVNKDIKALSNLLIALERASRAEADA